MATELTERLAMNFAQAAEACGVSVEIIRRAVEKGDLIPRYPSTRPVLLTKDLAEWLDTRPTERP